MLVKIIVTPHLTTGLIKMKLKLHVFLFAFFLLPSHLVYAQAWKTVYKKDEFTGKKEEITLVENSQYIVALACGDGPRGSDYTPRVLFSSKIVKGGSHKHVSWKIDNNEGFRRIYMPHSHGSYFYGPHYGNEGIKKKEFSDLLVSQMKSGNTILVSMDNKESSRLSLSGFANKYKYVEEQCKNVYPKLNQYYKQKVFYEVQ